MMSGEKQLDNSTKKRPRDDQGQEIVSSLLSMKKSKQCATANSPSVHPDLLSHSMQQPMADNPLDVFCSSPPLPIATPGMEFMAALGTENGMMNISRPQSRVASPAAIIPPQEMTLTSTIHTFVAETAVKTKQLLLSQYQATNKGTQQEVYALNNKIVSLNVLSEVLKTECICRLSLLPNNNAANVELQTIHEQTLLNTLKGEFKRVGPRFVAFLLRFMSRHLDKSIRMQHMDKLIPSVEQSFTVYFVQLMRMAQSQRTNVSVPTGQSKPSTPDNRECRNDMKRSMSPLDQSRKASISKLQEKPSKALNIAQTTNSQDLQKQLQQPTVLQHSTIAC